MCFLLVSFLSWERRTKSSEEQKALSFLFLVFRTKTVSDKPQEGEVMTWWFDVDSKYPRKNTGYVLIVWFFLAIPEATGGGISLSSGAPHHLPLCLHPSLVFFRVHSLTASRLGTAPTTTVHHVEASVLYVAGWAGMGSREVPRSRYLSKLRALSKLKDRCGKLKACRSAGC